MRGPKQTLIAREGWPLIATLAVVALIVSWNVGWLVGAPLWLLTAGTGYLFRDPKRLVPPLPLAVVSPVDGVVQHVAAASEDPCLDRQAQRITLCMGLTGAYSVRSPIEGNVVKRWVDRLVSKSCEPDAENDDWDDYGIWVQTDEKDDVVMMIPGGVFMRNPRLYTYAGDRLGQGQRCGFIRFGSRIDVLVPPGSRIKVEPGDRVSSGEAVLAKLVHQTVDEESVESAE